jgi:hypothetical protein
LIVLSIVLVPSMAHAFGPVAHVDMGVELLANAGLLATGVGRLISRHRSRFLLGTIDPDRVLVKNLAPYARHSHSWDVVTRLLKGSRDEAERASFLGQLCHLAADSVAHNYFIPMKMTESWQSPMAGHVYWEMRYDARIRRNRGPLLLETLSHDNSDHREFLQGVLQTPVFGPGFNIRMTGLALKMQKGNVFERASAYIDQESHLIMDDDEVEDARTLALKAQIEILTGQGHASLLKTDPRGLVALRRSRTLRKRLRGFRSGASWTEIDRVLRESRDQFRRLVINHVES